MSLRIVLLILAIASYAVVGVAISFVFVRRGPARTGLWTLRVVVVLADIFACWAIFAAESISGVAGWSGLAILLASDALFAWCVAATRGRPLCIAFSPDAPDRLLSRGPYAWSRHPFYSSYLLSYAAALVATLNPWLLVPIATVHTVLSAAARQEEASFARSCMARDYEEYSARVGRFMPRLRRLRLLTTHG